MNRSSQSFEKAAYKWHFSALAMLIFLAVCFVYPAQLSFAHSGDNEAFNAGESSGPEEIEVNEQGLRAIDIQLAKVRSTTLKDILETTGKVKADETRAFDVNPTVTGVVKAVYAKQGDNVSKGKVLALVHSIEVATTLTQLLNDRTRLNSDIARVQTQLKGDITLQTKQVQLSKVTFDREQGMLKEGISAAKNYHEAKNAHESAQVKLLTLQQRLEQEVKLLEKQLAVTTANAKGQLLIMGMTGTAVDTAIKTGMVTADLPVIAPVGGVITLRNITLGQRVSPEDSVFSIVNLSPIWIMIDVFQEQIPRVKQGQQVWIKTPSKQELRGEISSVGSVVDDATKTLSIRVIADNPNGILRPGMFVTAQVVVGQGTSQALVIPETAIVYFKERPFVYEKHEDHFQPVFVTTGLKTSQGVEVKEGLEADETIVVSGAAQLQAQSVLKPGSGHSHKEEGEESAHEEHHEDHPEHQEGHGKESGNSAASLMIFFAGAASSLVAVAIFAFFIRRSRKGDAKDA
jgi:cobalt-zinc-cadmium efflux system membrane fusion protein